MTVSQIIMTGEPPRTENETMLAAYIIQSGLGRLRRLATVGLFRLALCTLSVAVALFRRHLIGRAALRFALLASGNLRRAAVRTMTTGRRSRGIAVTGSRSQSGSTTPIERKRAGGPSS